MSELRKDIATTIYLPKHLTLSTEVVDIVYNILNVIYTYGVDTDIIPDKLVKEACKDVNSFQDELIDIVSANLHLTIWLWIGETVETWIEMAIKLEEFETATNLKKILECQYE
jgi:hypothetical protein